MKLSGDKKGILSEALIDAYRDYEPLERMVMYKLNKNLNEIVSTKSLDTAVFKLIQWAEKEGRLLDLIWGAYAGNPDNPKLKKVSDRLCCLRQEKWEYLCDLLAEIHKKDRNIIESILSRVFSPRDISEIDPQLINIKNLSDFSEVEKILKANFFQAPHRDADKPPIILKFAYCLLHQVREINNSIRDRLKCWVQQLADRLNIKLETLRKLKRQNTVKIQPYLLIIVESKDSDRFNLEAELIIQKEDCAEIVKKIPIQLDEQAVIQCSRNKIIKTIYKFICVSNRTYLIHYPNRKRIILEVFLPIKYLISPLELASIPDGLGGKKWIGCEYKLGVRPLERFTQTEYDFQIRLNNKWDDLNRFVATNPSCQCIKEKMECISTLKDDFNWDELEIRLDENKTLILNSDCPLSKRSHKDDFFKTIIKGGLPIAFWLRKCHIKPIDAEQGFTAIFAVDNFNNLENLFSAIQGIRKKAHAKRKKAKHYLGYHLGFLCDNPKRLPSRFDPEIIQEDILVFGI